MSFFKSSLYDSVYWIPKKGKWASRLFIDGQWRSGGLFLTDISAAFRSNEICTLLQIPLRNPGLNITVIFTTGKHKDL